MPLYQKARVVWPLEALFNQQSNGRAGLRPMGFKLRIGFRRHSRKRRDRKGRFFSLSLREREPAIPLDVVRFLSLKPMGRNPALPLFLAL
jgi:hypothetical protein